MGRAVSRVIGGESDQSSTSHVGIGLDGRAIVVVTEVDDHDRVITVMLDEER